MQIRLLTTGVLLFLIPASLKAVDWPRWLGPEGTGVSDETGWSPELSEPVWKTGIGLGFSAVSVADGKLYTMGSDGRGIETVWCLDVETGKAVWKDFYPARLVDNLHEGGPSATPCVSGGAVFTLSKDGKAHAYDAASGKRLWAVDMVKEKGASIPEWGFSGSPYVLGDAVLIEAGSTFALHRETGAEIWRSERFKPAYGTPVAFRSDGTFYLATLKTDGLVILKARDGSTAALTPWKTSFSTNANTPIVDGDRIFVSTGYNRGCGLFEFDGSSLRKIYENRAMSNHMSNAVLIDGYLYGFDGTAHRGPAVQFGCIKFDTGEVVWKTGGLGYGGVMAANGYLIILSERGELITAEATPSGFQPVSRAQVLTGRCWTMPVLANGRIFCRNAEGDLVCVDVRE